MEKITLKNGLRIILLPVPDVRSASFGIWVLSGSRFENPQNSGVSHFIEHMLFKGTQSRTAFDIAGLTDDIGGQINAFTAKEFTCFYGKTLDTHLISGLEMLVDMVKNPLFSQNDLDTERGVITEELDMYEDSPEDLASDLLHEGLFPYDMLKDNIAGTKDIVNSLKREDLLGHMKKTYTPNRMVIAVGGSYEKQEIIDKITSLLGDEPCENKESLKPQNMFENTVQTTCLKLCKKDFEQTSILLSLPVFGIGDTRRFSLSVINSILGGSQTSRMNQRIREELGLAYSAYSYVSGYIGTGSLIMGLQLNPKSENKALAETLKILNEFTNSLTEDEVKRTCDKIKINTVLGFESISTRVGFLGRNELLLEDLQTSDQIIAEIDNVSFSDVKKLSEEIFDIKKISLAAVGKVNNEAFYKKILAGSM